MVKPLAESDFILNKDGSIYHLNLKPGQVAETVIAVGDPERVQEISKHFDKVELRIRKREFVTHTGWFKGKRLSVISTGMGTDNVEIFITELDALFNVDFSTRLPKKKLTRLTIIRVGTSGGMQVSLPAGSLLASSFALGLDTLMAFYQLPQSREESSIAKVAKERLDLPFLPYCVQASENLLERFADLPQGITVTCPGFYGPQGRVVRISPRIPDMISKLSGLEVNPGFFSNFEMETAGYYAMGRLLGHDMLSLNAIVANRITNRFSDAPEKVVEKLISIVLKKI
ncbi:nucleoside phosphorylase [Cyclobacterium jeungdonense]|uniref:Uridine phosphorylase n=1 Tax=Cyclobacterium jeungdonense TaxID=708087 RepID=A0ABT8C871_9BACT|nr:nucleoside phosphorylase [Cyclobacterium jeungdonense]MDN3687823.1 nucleoside phosphorylase [Cyclobacterium jeungdonense]